MPTTPHIIQGFFWSDGFVEQPHELFSGEIQLSDDGKFQGSTTDCYGQAFIKGEVKSSVLRFIKEYEPGSRGSTFPLYYLLHSQSREDAGEILYGDWKGIYRINVRPATLESPHNGQASCSIYPLP